MVDARGGLLPLATGSCRPRGDVVLYDKSVRSSTFMYLILALGLEKPQANRDLI